MTAQHGGARPSFPVHLVILRHGLWGEPKHLLTLETLLRLTFGKRVRIIGIEDEEVGEDACAGDGASTAGRGKGAKETTGRAVLSKEEQAYLRPFVTDREEEVDMDIVILNTTSNTGSKTYDGIDWLGERVVQEMKEAQRHLASRSNQHIARLSVVGYSLGGLVARYVVGLLESHSFFSDTASPVEARQVVTIATPHIGSPPGSGAFGKVTAFIGGRLLSRTGEQLYCLDGGWESVEDAKRRDTKGRPERVGLLEHMARPRSVFVRALQRFQHVRFYANTVNDPTVPFRTGCIEAYDPFKEGVRVDVCVRRPDPKKPS